jgi:hypothetical protein
VELRFDCFERAGRQPSPEPPEAERHVLEGLRRPDADAVTQGGARDRGRAQREEQERGGFRVDRLDPAGGDGVVQQPPEQAGDRCLRDADELGLRIGELDAQTRQLALGVGCDQLGQARRGDQCSGQPVEGVVEVRDRVKRKTVLIKAGKRYTARARR